MDTRQLLLAVRLAEFLHFGKTADVENIAQSALSAQIAKLEGELGFQIFDRTSRTVTLSEAGKTFIERAREMLDGLSETVQECKAIADSNRAVLKIGFFGEAAGELTHAMFELFQRLNPSVRLLFTELNMNNQIQSLTSGKVDVAFIRTPIHDERLNLEIMFDEPRVAVVPKSHELADAPILQMSDLAEQPFAVAADGSPLGWVSYWALSPDSRAPARIAAQVNSVPESLAAIAYRGAFDTFPLTTTRCYSHPGVKYVPLADAPRSALALATTKGNRSRIVKAFRRCVAETLDQSLAALPEARRSAELVS